jgi:hypothetical protein
MGTCIIVEGGREVEALEGLYILGRETSRKGYIIASEYVSQVIHQLFEP